MPLPWSMVTTHPHMLSFSTESTVPALIALTASPFFAAKSIPLCTRQSPMVLDSTISPLLKSLLIFVPNGSMKYSACVSRSVAAVVCSCCVPRSSATPVAGTFAGASFVCTGAFVVRASICEFAPERPCVTGARPCTAPQTPKPTASKQHPSAI